MGKSRYYPWVIAFSALMVLFVTNGIPIGGLSVFDESLLNEFGWSRSQLKFRDLLTFAIAGVLGPLAGAVADRIGVRRLMIVGAVLLAICLAGYSRIQSSFHMYLVHVGFAISIVTAGLIVNVMLISRWFQTRRGTAVGIALLGTSLGGILLSPAGNLMIQRFGWRNTFLAEALLPVALLLVLVFVVRDSPESMGLTPHGADSSGTTPEQKSTAAASSATASLPGMSYKEALSTATFWALALVAMTTFFSILGVSAHLFLHLRDLGLSPERAALGISLLFTFGLVGKFLIGMIADFVDHKVVLLCNLGIMFIGSLCLASMSLTLFWPFLILFGIGWGGLYTLLQVLIVDSFGLRASGKILGTITVLDAVGGGLGPFLIGFLFDQSGSYGFAFSVVSGLILFATICGLFVRRDLAAGHA